MTHEERQRLAADILTEFMLSDNFDDTWNRIYERYNLHEDPFTLTPCSDEEYQNNMEEYNRQLMEDKYGLFY